MRKILFIPLFIILVAVFFFGRSYANKPIYTDEEIMDYNEELLEERMEEEQENTQQYEDVQEPDEESQIEDVLQPDEDETQLVIGTELPVIRAIYPADLEDGDTVEADRVYLQFFSENEIISVTANEMEVPSTIDTVINTPGTFEIVVTDEYDNESSFTFTLIK